MTGLEDVDPTVASAFKFVFISRLEVGDAGIVDPLPTCSGVNRCLKLRRSWQGIPSRSDHLAFADIRFADLKIARTGVLILSV